MDVPAHTLLIELLDGSTCTYKVTLDRSLVCVVKDLHARGKCGNESQHNLHFKYEGDVLEGSLTIAELFGLIPRPGKILLVMTTFPTHVLNLTLPCAKNADPEEVAVHVHTDLAINDLFVHMATDAVLHADPNLCCLVHGGVAYGGSTTINNMLGDPSGSEIDMVVRVVTCDDGGDSMLS